MKRASSAEVPASSGSRGLWLLVIAGFALLTAVYVVAVHFAREAQIREVPVATKGVTP